MVPPSSTAPASTRGAVSKVLKFENEGLTVVGGGSSVERVLSKVPLSPLTLRMPAMQYGDAVFPQLGRLHLEECIDYLCSVLPFADVERYVTDWLSFDTECTGYIKFRERYPHSNYHARGAAAGVDVDAAEGGQARFYKHIQGTGIQILPYLRRYNPTRDNQPPLFNPSQQPTSANRLDSSRVEKWARFESWYSDMPLSMSDRVMIDFWSYIRARRATESPTSEVLKVPRGTGYFATPISVRLPPPLFDAQLAKEWLRSIPNRAHSARGVALVNEWIENVAGDGSNGSYPVGQTNNFSDRRISRPNTHGTPCVDFWDWLDVAMNAGRALLYTSCSAALPPIVLERPVWAPVRTPLPFAQVSGAVLGTAANDSANVFCARGHPLRPRHGRRAAPWRENAVLFGSTDPHKFVCGICFKQHSTHV